MALWWLLPAGMAPVGLVGVPFAELGGLLEDFEGLRHGKQTLNAYKTLLLRPWSALEPLL